MNRRGRFFTLFLVVLSIAILITAYVEMKQKYDALGGREATKNLGVKQFELVSLYGEAEKAQQYIDIAAQYAAERAVSELAHSGGIISGCGSAPHTFVDRGADSVTLWESMGTECYPTRASISRDFQRVFNQEIAPYLSKYPHPNLKMPSGFDLQYKDSLDVLGFASNELVIEKGKLALDPGGRIGGGTCGEGIVRVAQEELAKDVAEWDPEVYLYTAGREEHWCADFVSWVYKESQNPFDNTYGYGAEWQIPSCRNMKDYFSKNEIYFSRGDQSPQPGDVVFFSWRCDGNLDHVGIVESFDGSIVTTIEGNSNDRVKRKTYAIDNCALVGFGRPKQCSLILAEGTETIEAGKFTTPVYIIDSGTPGPTVAVLGGVHGDELAGSEAAKAIATMSTDKGILIVIPEANRPALVAGARRVPQDLNRAFTSTNVYATSPTDFQKLVQGVYTYMSLADYVIDLHEYDTSYYSTGGGKGRSVMARGANTIGQSVVAKLNTFVASNGLPNPGARWAALGQSYGSTTTSYIEDVTGGSTKHFFVETCCNALPGHTPTETRVKEHIAAVSFILQEIGVALQGGYSDTSTAISNKPTEPPTYADVRLTQYYTARREFFPSDEAFVSAVYTEGVGAYQKDSEEWLKTFDGHNWKDYKREGSSHPNGYTASGPTPEAHRTVAVDPHTIPYGTTLWIDWGPGHDEWNGCYIAEDTGSAFKAKGPYHIDLYVGDQGEADYESSKKLPLNADVWVTDCTPGAGAPDSTAAPGLEQVDEVVYKTKPSFRVHVEYDLFGAYSAAVAHARSVRQEVVACLKAGSNVIGDDDVPTCASRSGITARDHEGRFYLFFSFDSSFGPVHFDDRDATISAALLIEDNIPPPLVRNIVVTGNAKDGASISWDKDFASDTASYNVHCSQSDYEDASSISSVPTTDTSITLKECDSTALQPGETYYFSISAEDEVGNVLNNVNVYKWTAPPLVCCETRDMAGNPLSHYPSYTGQCGSDHKVALSLC